MCYKTKQKEEALVEKVIQSIELRIKHWILKEESKQQALQRFTRSPEEERVKCWVVEPEKKLIGKPGAKK